MRLYLTAETSIPDLYIDYIEVLLKSGEEVSLNWDYSDIERTPSGFRPGIRACTLMKIMPMVGLKNYVT